MPWPHRHPPPISFGLVLAAPLDATQIRAILLDIEGTTTPVEFVYEVLFPYARQHVEEFLAQNYSNEEVRPDMEKLLEEHLASTQQDLEPPPWRDETINSQVESAAAYVRWLMDRDRKSTALKSLQGKIWELGYREGALHGQVYSDVRTAFARWSRQKRLICIFSSGSILAQKLLFAHTHAGDLTPFLHAYFDTTTGAKTQPESYERIASALDLAPSSIAFFSDVVAELDAAQMAGMQTVLCVRPGRPEPPAGFHLVIRSFEEVFP